jgi:hypothetical protein
MERNERRRPKSQEKFLAEQDVAVTEIMQEEAAEIPKQELSEEWEKLLKV